MTSHPDSTHREGSVSNKTLILNSSKATTYNLAIGKATFILADTLRFTDKKPKIAINAFSFTNFFKNISASIGNNKFYYSDDDADETKYTITIPDGSYTPEALNTMINDQLVVDGYAPALFSILSDYSQNKIYYKFSAVLTGWFVHYDTDSPFTVLGGTTGQNIPADTVTGNVANQIEYATNVAAFNNVTDVNVTSNLSNNIIYGTNQSSILYNTSPSVSVGSVQVDRPYNLMWTDSLALQGGISEIQLQVVNQEGVSVEMYEHFTVTIQIQY